MQRTSLVLVALLISMTGCGGGSGGSGDSGMGGDGGTGIDGGPGTDSGPAFDGGPDFDAGPGMDAGPATDAGPGTDGGPGAITCGSMTCDGATQRCCITGSAGGGVMASCIPIDGMCSGATVACDGPEDCEMGQVCCARFVDGAAVARCTAARMCTGGGSFEACHDTPDCSSDADMCCTIDRFGFSGGICSMMCPTIAP